MVDYYSKKIALIVVIQDSTTMIMMMVMRSIKMNLIIKTIKEVAILIMTESLIRVNPLYLQ